MAKGGQKVVKQASFLMAAHLVSSVIGLLYRSPLRGIMGDVGAGYYTYAYDWYTILLLISSYSIPAAVSKVMSERLAVREYRNAFRVFRTALLYVVAVGILAGSAAYFLAPWLLRNTPDAVLSLRILAPTIFLSGLLGVFRGLFQAHNTMKPTAVSQVLEQIMNALFSILMAALLIRPHLGNDGEIAKYGSAGGTMGTLLSVSSALIFMVLIYLYNRKGIRKRIARDKTRHTESYRDAFRDIILMVTPIILATCVFNLTTIIDQRIFTSLLSSRGVAAEEISAQYGLFGYQFKPIHNIPVSLASAVSTALIPAVAASLAERKRKEAMGKIEECIRLTLFVAVPSAVGLTILARPVIRLLYPGGNVAGASSILLAGACAVILYSLSTIMNGVLQSTGHPMIPVRNSLIAIAVNAAFLYFTCGLLKMGIYSVVLTHIVYGLCVCVLHILSIRKRLGYRSDLVKTYFVPILSATIMGAVVALIYYVPARLLPGFSGRYIGNAVLTLFSVLAGVFVYVIAYTKLSGKTDEEIRALPLGSVMLSMLYRLRVR